MTHPTVQLDPELASALATLRQLSGGGKLLDLSDIPRLREQLRIAAEQAPVREPDQRVAVSTLQVPRPDGSLLDIVLFRPGGDGGRQPALLWFHAGGQVLGSAHDDAPYHSALALALGCTVAAVDYRLAPETPAPGGAEDGYLAYTHLHENADEHGLDAERIGLAGASGGGAIAAAAALMVRDRNAPRPVLLSLSYAMLDDRNDTPSSHEITDVGVWDRSENELGWQAVLGDRAGTPDLDPHCAPGRAVDLSGLPPTFIAAAQYDVFRDEDLDFGRRLIAAGVPVDLHHYAGAFHAWDRMASETELTRSFEQTWHAFLRRRLHC